MAINNVSGVGSYASQIQFLQEPPKKELQQQKNSVSEEGVKVTLSSSEKPKTVGFQPKTNESESSQETKSPIGRTINKMA